MNVRTLATDFSLSIKFLVEFKSAENALEAKTILDNTELFPDEPWLTTLNVEFSFQKELKIEENIRVEIARDFTKNPM